jgi:hypothetical protein
VRERRGRHARPLDVPPARDGHSHRARSK